jgi:quercetin dioxygenase-like cupin family protein
MIEIYQVIGIRANLSYTPVPMSCRIAFWTLLPVCGLVMACPGAPVSRTPGNANGRQADPDAPVDRVGAALTKNLGQYRRRLRRCHELAMAGDYRVGGRVTLELLVRPQGVVTHVKVLHNTSGSSLLSTCVGHVVKSFVFPAGDADLRLPLKLRFAQPKTKLTVRMDDVLAKAKLGKGVMAKVLLHPKSVSGNRLSLLVLRLAPGAKLPPLRYGVDLGLYVLQGVLKVTGGTASAVLRTGDSAAIRANVTHGLQPAGTGMCAVLVFMGPAGPESLFLTGKPAAGSAWQPLAKPVLGSPLALRGLAAGPGDLTLRGAVLPVPQVITVPQGRTALLNPDAAPMHHALLVTEGAFYVTLEGVRLPAETGMAIYVPGGQKAIVTPVGGRAGRFVVQPWPSRGAWSSATVHRLVKLR